MFSYQICEIFKNTYFVEHLRAADSDGSESDGSENNEYNERNSENNERYNESIEAVAHRCS